MGFSVEGMGFEPTMSFWPIHTFQACSFDHSDTPLGFSSLRQRYGARAGPASVWGPAAPRPVQIGFGETAFNA